MSAVQALPTGTVTFLFADIEGSTLMVQALGERWADVLVAQRRVMREAIAAGDGREMGTEGDSFFVVFASAIRATRAVVAAQRALAREEWPAGFPVRLRMGLHTGEARLVAGDYMGLEVHRAARIAAAGHGGQILLSESTHALIEKELPAGTTVRDLGEHRLKDLPRPERIFQLEVEGLPSEFPALKSLNIRRNNLPLQLSSFLGRGQELRELKGLLAHDRLVTLIGSGGVGKTRLAIELGSDLLEAYAQGVWLVELASISDPQLVAPTVLSVFGLREQAGRSPIATLIDYLHERKALVILDNCEHLIAACAELAGSLLQGCPGLKMVATSREALGVPGETGWRVPSLPVPDLRRLPSLDVVAESAAVALFCERGSAVNSAFALTDRNAPLVVQVCRELDGIPLAIELAAARLKLLSLEQIAGRLKDRFRLLTGGSRTALPRQQTLRAAIDWSYELLAEPERALLRRLSIFAGGFSLEAVEQVCTWAPLDPFDMLDLLTAVVSKSLVVVEEERLEPRYHLLDTIRQYARERLGEAGEDRQQQVRHREWFLSLAEQAALQLHGSEQFAWFERLETELENLRSGFECLLEGGEGDAALGLATALGLLWRARGRFSEGRDWLERALRATRGSRSGLRARGLAWAGLLTSYQGGYTQAIALQEESIAIAQELHDTWAVAFALQNLAAALHAQDDYERAVAMHEESLALFRQTGDKPSIGLALTHLGFSALYRGDYGEAMRRLEDALGLFREVDDKRQIGIALQLMGEVELTQARYTRASSLLEESLALVREARDKVDIAYTLRLRGIVARCQEDYERASALQRESLELAREFNIGEFAAQSLSELGIVALLQHDYKRAASLLSEALPLFDPREQFGISRCLEGLGSSAYQQGELVTAATLFGAADALRRKIGSPLHPYELTGHESHFKGLRAILGSQAFDEAVDAGAAMSVKEMMAFALWPVLPAAPAAVP